MPGSSITTFASFISKAAQDVLKKGAGIDIHVSKTFQRVLNIKLGNEIGSFVSFKGDYDGIVVMNFTGEASVEIVNSYLKTMGMPEEDIPTSHTSDDIRNNIGEIINQIMGNFRSQVQKRYDLVAISNIPAVVPVAIPIGLVLDSSDNDQQECIRVALSTPESKRFYIEISMEPTRIIEMG